MKVFKDLSLVIDSIRSVLKPRTLVLLDGDLGSGKTTLIRELLKSIGYDQATSPTYALHHRYLVKLDNQSLSVEHLDLYRLENEDQIESSGLWDFFQTESQSLILVEWANRIPMDQWPLDWSRYRLRITKNDSERNYEFFKF